MEKKKKFIIIIIILLIFLGLMIFTFANPKDGEVEEKGPGKDTEEKVDKQDDNEDESSEDLDSDDENQEGVTNTVVGNSNVNTQSVTDDSYDKALKAVIEAENKIDSQSYDKAKELVDKVTDSSKKKELQDRLDVVKDEIDIKGLVETLKSKTYSAANREELDSARDYRIDEEILDKVAGLDNADLKDELNKVLDELSTLLDDEDKPEVSVDENYKIVVEDQNDYMITVKRNDGVAEEVGKDYILSEDGIYTITVVDAAFNETTITYIKDTTAPEISLNGDSTIYIEAGLEEYEEMYATVTDNIDETITNLAPVKINYTKPDGTFGGEVEKVDSTKPGTYKVVYEYTDNAGNKGVNKNDKSKEYVIRTVIVRDTTAPEISLNGDSTIYIEAGLEEYEEKYATVTDNIDETITNLAPVKINYTKPDGTFGGKVEKVDSTKPGTYKVVYEYTDNAGNKGVNKNDKSKEYVIRTVIVRDTIAPTIEEVRVQKTGGSTDPVNLDGTLLISVIVGEKLPANPVITINEKAVSYTSVDNRQLASGNYLYTFHAVKLTSEMKLVNGNKIPVTVTVKDEYENENKLTTTGETYGYSVEFDSEAPEIIKVMMGNETQGSQYVKTGDRIWVYVTYNEELNETPTLKIGNNVGKLEYASLNENGSGEYTYALSVEVPEGLDAYEGEKIPFIVTNAVDIAGNKAADVNEVSEGTWHIVDNTSVNISSLTVFTIGENNRSNNTLAKVGDTLQVVIRADDYFKENPELWISDKKVADFKFTEINGNDKIYAASYYIYDGTVEDDAVFEYVIKGLTDEALNKSVYKRVSTDTLTNLDAANEVKFDITAPTITFDTLEDGALKAVQRIQASDMHNIVLKITDSKGNVRRTEEGTNTTSFKFFGYPDDTYKLDLIDIVGNKIDTITFITDSTKPTIDLRDYNRSSVGKKEQSITADIVEANIKSIKYVWYDKSSALDDASLEKVFTDNVDKVVDVDLSTLKSDGNNHTLTITNSELNGKYYFYLRVEDKSGNLKIVKSAPIYFDSSAAISEVMGIKIAEIPSSEVELDIKYEVLETSNSDEISSEIITSDTFDDTVEANEEPEEVESVE